MTNVKAKATAQGAANNQAALRTTGVSLRVLIIVENLPVPLDRRVWQEACALRDAGHRVTVICPRMRGYSAPFEVLDGIIVYRHWITGEARGIKGFVAEYTSALWGELTCAIRAWRRTGFDVIHLCNPPDLLFLVALPFTLIAGVRVVYDVHDLWPEMFEEKFGKRGLLYWCVRLAERSTLGVADVVLATNESVRSVVLARSRKTAGDVFVVRTAPSELPTTIAPDVRLRNGKRFLVGYIGVMGKTDGVQYLLEAARHVVLDCQRQDVQFLLMGTGPEYTDLVAYRDALGLQECVAMPGRVSNEFLFTALQTMDLGVACDPINEFNDHCTMNKTLEYMAFGKAQVMFGTREGRRSAGAAAHYVPENSPLKLGDAIIGLLDNEAGRLLMGNIGQQRLTNVLNWKRSVEQLLKAYATVGKAVPTMSELVEPSGETAKTGSECRLSSRGTLQSASEKHLVEPHVLSRHDIGRE